MLRKIFLFVFILFISISCNKYEVNNMGKYKYLYLGDSLISSRSGMPINAVNPKYFPDRMIFIQDDSVFVKHTGVLYFDSVKATLEKLQASLDERPYWSSQVSLTPDYLLLKANEPILSNSYLGRDIYRFTWKGSFDAPIIFILFKEKERVTLTIKVFENLRGGSINDKFEVKVEEQILSFDEWAQFEFLLNKSEFWKMNPMNYEEVGMFTDGSSWTIEAHLKNNYWFVNRRSPQGNLLKCGELLMSLSKLDLNIY